MRSQIYLVIWPATSPRRRFSHTLTKRLWSSDRDRAAVSLDAGAFPIVADNDALFIYIPIRRYARGVIHPQPYSVIDRYLTPNDVGNSFQREEAVLAWAVRDLYWRNRVAQRTFPSLVTELGPNAPIPFDSLVDLSNVQGTVALYLYRNGGTLGNRDGEGIQKTVFYDRWFTDRRFHYILRIDRDNGQFHFVTIRATNPDPQGGRVVDST